MGLLQQIESLREEMIAQGMKSGLSDDKTVETSKELDKLINLALEKGINV